MKQSRIIHDLVSCSFLVLALLMVITFLAPFHSNVSSAAALMSTKVVERETSGGIASADPTPSMNIDMLCPIFQKAYTQNTSIIIMGDSRSSVGWGPGSNFVAALNYYFYKHYGKLGMTPIAPGTDPLPNGAMDGALGISSYHGYPWGIQNSDPTMYPPPIDATPYHWNRLGAEAQGAYIFTDGNATTLNPEFLIPTSRNYFKLGSTVTAEYFLRRGPEFTDKILTQVDATTQEYWNPETETPFVVKDVPQVHQSDSGFFSYKEIITAHAANASNPLINVGLRIKPYNTASSTNVMEVLGGRFISSVEKGGVAVSSFSMGGWTTNLHLSRKNQSIAYAAMNPDLLLVFLDVNDIGNNVSPQEYKQNMIEIITRYREAMKNMKAPVVLMSGYPVPEPEYYTVDYPNMLKEIVASDPNVAWINGYAIYADRAEIDPGKALDAHLTNGADAMTFGERVANVFLSSTSAGGQRKCAAATTKPSFSTSTR